MSLYIQLQLSGLLLNDPQENFSEATNPVLIGVMQSLGFGRKTLSDPKALEDYFTSVIASVEDRFAYYGQSELKVNSSLDDYLKDVLRDLSNNHHERSTTLAMTICGMGNKGGECNCTQAVNELTEEAFNILTRLGEMVEDTECPVSSGCLIEYVKDLEYLDKVLELVDVFVASKAGAIAGVPEYPPVDAETLDEIPEPDFSLDGMECLDTSECKCGCIMEHPLKIVEGMEDFFNGVESPNSIYFLGVASANGIRLNNYTGNEGATFDALKELGRKAWQQLVDSLKAIKSLFDGNSDEQKVKEAHDSGENNKKAFQAMKAIPAKINDKARAGIISLTESIDVSGKVKSIVAALKTPADAPRVIDGLLGVMGKEAGTSSELNKEFAAATTAVNELKTAADSTQGDESNKDVVAANKAKVSGKTKIAKEALKKVKFKLAEHNKLMVGIKKAIAGISPKIFIVDESATKDKGKKEPKE